MNSPLIPLSASQRGGVIHYEMKKYSLAILLLTVAPNIFASPLHPKLKHTIIIDTDCSVYDLRAVTILLSHPGITVKAIIISDGQVQANEGYVEIGSYAGSVEPLSCMNDGLQVSTGATLGQGTIRLADDPALKPQAVFSYQDKSIMLKLKPEYLKKLKAVIDEGVKNYGLEDEDYWNLIRQTSIKFWLEWDRKEIFDIAEL